MQPPYFHVSTKRTICVKACSRPSVVVSSIPMPRPLTELEGCVLGVFVRSGPCTPYFVRKEFLNSYVPLWSGSAGAIYPLVNRLKKAGLLEVASGRGRLEGSRRFRITKKGRDVLRTWLNSPAEPSVIGPPADPIRNRIEFLISLTPRARNAFLLEVEVRISKQLDRMEREIESHDRADYFEFLAVTATIASAKARLEWVKECRMLLGRKKLLD
jgi:DNA-binding PadR family transcriptional regulator